MKTDLQRRFCWKRPRLIGSELLWLAVYLLMALGESAFVSLPLVFVAALLYPKHLAEQSDRQWLWGAFGVVIAMPLMALYVGVPAVRAFLHTPSGFVLLSAVWVAGVISQFRFYRSLPPFRCRTHVTPSVPTHPA